jgi:hypothetical protein
VTKIKFSFNVLLTFPGLLYDIPDHRGLGARTGKLNGWDLKEPAGILDEVSWAVYSMASRVKSMAHQAPPANSRLSPETAFRRWRTSRSRLAPNESKMVDAEASELHGPILERSEKMVWIHFRSPVYVAEIIVGISWRCCEGGESTTA